MKNKKDRTIKDFMEEKKAEKELKKKYNFTDDTTVVIEKKNIFVQILLFLQNTFIKILKFSFIIVIACLSTIGLTTLINEPLRVLLFEIIKNSF